MGYQPDMATENTQLEKLQTAGGQQEVQGGMHALTCKTWNNRKHAGGRSAKDAGRHACTDLHALPSQGCLPQLCGILTHSIWVGEALVPLDQGAVVHTDLSQREAEAEADDRHAVRLWPASLHFAVAMRVHASVGA